MRKEAQMPSWDLTLVQPGEYDRTVRLGWRCGLMSSYFNHLLLLQYYELMAMYEVLTHCYCLQVKDMAESIQPGVTALACGSYRRGRATCGDVDILITHPDGLSHQGIFKPLIARLHETGVKCFLLFPTVLSYLASPSSSAFPQ